MSGSGACAAAPLRDTRLAAGRRSPLNVIRNRARRAGTAGSTEDWTLGRFLTVRSEVVEFSRKVTRFDDADAVPAGSGEDVSVAGDDGGSGRVGTEDELVVVGVGCDLF